LLLKETERHERSDHEGRNRDQDERKLGTHSLVIGQVGQ